MKYTREKFDCSDEAINALKKEHAEAKEFVWDWIQEKGLMDCGCGLDFEDIFDLLAQYKRCLKLPSIEGVNIK